MVIRGHNCLKISHYSHVIGHIGTVHLKSILVLVTTVHKEPHIYDEKLYIHILFFVQRPAQLRRLRLLWINSRRANFLTQE